MLIIFDEHVHAVLGRCKCCTCHACKELFRDTSAINTSFRLVELIYESNLDRLFQTLTELIELRKRIFELYTAPNACSVLFEMMAGVRSLHNT